MLGVLLNNQWSVGGNALRPAVNTGLAQPFVNYNMEKGWYLTTSPIITVNWLAASGEKWTVPVGGGFGRVFRVGDQPVNAQMLPITTRKVPPAHRIGNCGPRSHFCSRSNSKCHSRTGEVIQCPLLALSGHWPRAAAMIIVLVSAPYSAVADEQRLYFNDKGRDSKLAVFFALRG